MNTVIENYKDVNLREEIREKLESVEKVIRKNEIFKVIKNIYVGGFHADNTARDSDEIFIRLVSLDDNFTSEQKFKLQSDIEDQCEKMTDRYVGVLILDVDENVIEENIKKGNKYLRLI